MDISEISEIILKWINIANLRDECTGLGLRAVLEAPPAPPPARDFREASLVTGAAEQGPGDVARVGALARRRGGALPLRKRRVEVSHSDWFMLKPWGPS